MIWLTFVTSLLISLTTATHFDRIKSLLPPLEEDDIHADAFAAKAVNTTGSGFFSQLIEHSIPGKGNFNQKYWYSSEFWGGPGSPIIFFTPGEVAAARYGAYLTNVTITGRLAQELKGAIVLVEHRYYGESSPYQTLDAETLQALTLENALKDNINIAKTLKLPFDPSGASNADKAPWIFVGGSYSGSLSAWTASMYPGTFWAYQSTSAPTEAIYDYWQYFKPVEQGMPKNCSKDVNLVIEHVDDVLKHGTADDIYALKASFGLGNIEHNDDFASVLENGPWFWQSNSFYTGYSIFYKFCDAVEGVAAGAAVTPDANGVGLEKALAGYANFTNSTIVPGICEGYGYDSTDLSCLDSYNASNYIFTNLTVQNPGNRQWFWMLCNEPFAWWQDGAPRHETTLISRLVTASYWQRQCALWFPTVNGFTYGSAISPDNNVHQVNKHTQGWRLEDTERLIFINGEFDPWRTAGHSSEYRPGGPLVSTEKLPVHVIPGGFHCSDLRLRNGEANAGVQAVIDAEIRTLVKWAGEFYKRE